ncbi:hypothetical protein UP10_00735 [Bradyrhizobium sp. LTSPM299]|nr:hypothetical protein UP10_00735 [Bradyrhizobium sp. LTSPM299]
MQRSAVNAAECLRAIHVVTMQFRIMRGTQTLAGVTHCIDDRNPANQAEPGLGLFDSNEPTRPRPNREGCDRGGDIPLVAGISEGSSPMMPSPNVAFQG